MKKSKNKFLKKIVLGCAIVFAMAIGAIAYLCSLTAAKPNISDPVRVYVPAIASPESIADSIAHACGDSYASKVMQLWKWQGGKQQVANGSYVITPSTSALSMSRRLLHGQQNPVKVTFNNIRTIDQLAERIGAQLEITPAQFIEGCDSVLSVEGYTHSQYIGAFIPDTYEFYWNASPQRVVEKLHANMAKFWNDKRTEQARDLGLSPIEVSTLASIVEEETAKGDERPMVARLYLNRLAKNMMLQADPTVKFATGDFGLRRITAKHLDIDSPYNTYKHTGLPPGPIRMPSAKGLDAVLNAPSHNYLYMCAKEDFSGYHNFAADYQTHLANARRYQAQLNRRGIK